MNEPIGRRGSLIPARARRTASATSRTASSWPITRSCRTSSRRSSFSRSPSSSRATGIPVHRATISAISSSVTSSRSRRVPALLLLEALLLAPQPALELRQPAVAQLGGPVEVVAPLGVLDLPAHLLELLAQRLELVDRLALGLPLRAHRVRLGPQVGELLAQRLEPLLARLVLLLLQRRLLDLELHHTARDRVELLRHRVDLGADHRARLVDQVDRLVGQEPIGDVPVRKRGRGDQRGVLDPHAVVHLEALSQAAQDRDRVLDRRLVDHHRLEAALERGVLLDVLAVLVERGRARCSGAHRGRASA